MKKTIERINEIRQNGFELKFETVFEDAIENYKKVVLYSALLFFVFSVAIAILFVAIFKYYQITMADVILFQEKVEKGLLSAQETLCFSATALFINAALAPLIAGFYKMVDAGKKDVAFKAFSVFRYYKPPYVFNVFLAFFIIELINISGVTLLTQINQKFLSTILSTIIMLFTAFVIPFIIFGKLNAIQSIKASILIFTKKPLLLIALLILGYLGSFVGLIALIFGVFFTIIFDIVMKYSIYTHIIGTVEEE